MGMSKRAFLKSDWFLGVVIALILAVAARGDLVQSLERKAYDLGVNAVSRTPSDKIAVIAIDDRSISNIGRWPWSRDVHARMTDVLAAAQAKVIVNSTFFFEPQIDPGLGYINKLLDLYAKSVPPTQPDAAVPAPGVATVPEAKAAAAPVPVTAVAPEIVQFGALLRKAEQALNTDRKLAEAFSRAGNVMLPLTEPQGNPDKPLPDYVMANSLAFNARGADVLPMPGINPLYPIAALGGSAAGIGHLNSANDIDGAVRAEQLAGMKIEGRSDLFSLGATLYQMCCGYLPFKGDSMAQLMFKIANDPHTDIVTYNPVLPMQVVAVINRALAKQPESRYQTGDEMAKALRECIGNTSAVSNPDAVNINL